MAAPDLDGFVMPGLVPGIHVLACKKVLAFKKDLAFKKVLAFKKDVDGRIKPGHDA